MKIAILVPRRSDGGRRDQLWSWCRPRWEEAFPDCEIVEGNCENGPFNRSAAINDAAEIAGDWDVAIIVDGDVFVPPEQVEAAVQSASASGRACFAFTDYFALNRSMTDRVLEGHDGDWRPGLNLKMLAGRHVSSCIVVPRPLWDEVDGFDERFVGWGAEDVAFMLSCRVLGGGVDRVAGAVWHLWHPTTLERDKHLPDYRAGEALSHRYMEAHDPDVMRSVIAGRRTVDAVCLLVMTDGRRDAIEPTITSIDRHLHGNITRRIIHDDSGDVEYAAWLRLTFPDWDIVSSGKRSGFGGAMIRATHLELSSGEPWAFHVEDDFIFQRDVHICDMQMAMTKHPHLVQMALRRQAWFPAEVAAGGVVEQNPSAYEDHFGLGSEWLEHSEFYTTNPSLLCRGFLAGHPWPKGNHSEAAFARSALRDGSKSGYWGSRHDDPWVHHIGVRQGTGY